MKPLIVSVLLVVLTFGQRPPPHQPEQFPAKPVDIEGKPLPGAEEFNPNGDIEIINEEREKQGPRPKHPQPLLGAEEFNPNAEEFNPNADAPLDGEKEFNPHPNIRPEDLNNTPERHPDGKPKRLPDQRPERRHDGSERHPHGPPGPHNGQRGPHPHPPRQDFPHHGHPDVYPPFGEYRSSPYYNQKRHHAHFLGIVLTLVAFGFLISLCVSCMKKRRRNQRRIKKLRENAHIDEQIQYHYMEAQKLEHKKYQMEQQQAFNHRMAAYNHQHQFVNPHPFPIPQPINFGRPYGDRISYMQPTGQHPSPSPRNDRREPDYERIPTGKPVDSNSSFASEYPQI